MDKTVVATKEAGGEPVQDPVATTRKDWIASEAECLDGGCGDPTSTML